MRLSKWMALNGMADGHLAEKTGVDRATISRIRRGKHRPSWELMLRLREMTQGAVTADDFLFETEAAE